MPEGDYDSFKEKQLYACKVHFLDKNWQTLTNNIIVTVPEALESMLHGKDHKFTEIIFMNGFRAYSSDMSTTVPQGTTGNKLIVKLHTFNNLNTDIWCILSVVLIRQSKKQSFRP